MGNRAVISFGKTHTENNMGIYVHWNGGRDSIEGFLTATRQLMGGRLGDESYGIARCIQCVTAFFEGNLSVGVGVCSGLDCDNGDNGTYIVDPATMEIVGREYPPKSEQKTHDSNEIAKEILKKVESKA